MKNIKNNYDKTLIRFMNKIMRQVIGHRVIGKYSNDIVKQTISPMSLGENYINDRYEILIWYLILINIQVDVIFESNLFMSTS